MKNRDRKNSELDALGTLLISSAALRQTEIDRIVSKPGLYTSVLSRINSEQSLGQIRFGFRAVAAFASLAMVLSVSSAVYWSLSHSGKERAVQTEVVKPVEIKRSSIPDIVEPVTPIAEIDEPVIASEPRRIISPAQTVSYRKPVVESPKTNRIAIEPKPELEFFPLAYAGETVDTLRGGRIIRVEMSRASLFAMGVNVPIENGSETIKADILMGADGVPRGIRMPN